MRHDKRADEPRGYPERHRIPVFLHTVFIGEFNIERLGKILPQIVRGTRLQALAVVHHGFHAVGRHGARELFLFGLFPREHGHGKAGLGKFRIYREQFLRFLFRLFGGGEYRMSFLPQKFTRTQEGTRGLFPPHHVRPLIHAHGQIAPAFHPLAVHGADDRFGSRAHAKRFLQFFPARMRDDGDFGREPFDVLRLFCHEAHGNKQREIGVFVSVILKTFVEFLLNIFPDRISVRADDHRPLYGAVIDELGFQHDVGIPLRKIGFDICDLCYELLFFCHNSFLVTPNYTI